MREVVFGDIGINTEVVSPDPCGGGVPAAGSLVLTFLLNNYQDPDYQRLAEQWEKEVGAMVACLPSLWLLLLVRSVAVRTGLCLL